MRLTLRTMLAYLDDILEPRDADELRQKIEKSPDAAKLVHRIRNSITRIRLGSPKLVGQGIGADPNTVAEYLDNTLPADRVPEMERVCLDSDMHLAEVAASHQILALVLGEPARVESTLRQRVYALGRLPSESLKTIPGEAAGSDGESLPIARSTASNGERMRVDMVAAVRDAAVGRTNGATAEEPIVATAVVVREKPVVPEYLREGRKNRPYMVLAVALLAGFVLTAGAMLVIDQTYGLGRLVGLAEFGDQGADASDKVADGSVGQLPNSGSASDAATTGTGEQGSAGTGEVLPDVSAPDAGSSADVWQDDNVGETTNSGQGEYVAEIDPTDQNGPANEPGPDAGTVVDSSSSVESSTLPATPAPSVDDIAGAESSSAETVTDAVPLENEQPGDVIAPPPVPDTVAGTGSELPGLEANVGDGQEPPTTDGTASDGTASDAMQVGRVSSHEQVLAFMDEAADTWYRLPERGPVVVGQRLAVMPTFRPQFLLIPSAIQVTAVEGTTLEVLPPNENQTPVFRAMRARLILMPYQQAGGQVALAVGDQLVTIFLGDLNTVVAVQADHAFAPGDDPTSGLRVPVTRIWAMGGHARVETTDHPAQEVADGQLYVLVERRAGQVVSGVAPPKWMDTKAVSDIDRRVSPELELRMRDDRPLALVLAELADDLKVRVDKRSLADRCLASLGSFDYLVRSLDDETLYSAWPYHFDELRGAVERSPETASALRDAFRRVYGESGDELFRTVWGYSSRQLEGGEATKLVGYLEHEELAYRVLGFENLRRITGANLYYQPQNAEARRRQSLSRWREKLAQGGIVYDKEPEWLPNLPPSTSE